MLKISSSQKIDQAVNRALAKNKITGLAKDFSKQFPKAEIFLVGGLIRDILMGRSKNGDLDFVVRNITADELKKFLSSYGKVDLVGKNFGVFKFKPRGGDFIDFALPRTEHSLGTGAYRDFKIQSDPNLPLKKDLGRRDFTINALAWDLKSKKLIDYFNGINDIRAGIIRAVGQPKQRFLEDYSRMLRALRFAAELNFSIERQTWSAIKKLIRLINKKKQGNFIVPREIIAKEFLKSFYAQPLDAFEWWDGSGAFSQLVPEITALKSCGQPKDFHAEGDAWKHIRLALDVLNSKEFSQEFKQKQIPLYVSLGVLFHDIAKPKTAAPKSPRRGHISFPGHARLGADMTRQIVKRLRLESHKAEGVDINPKKLAWLVEQHMFILGNDPKSVPWTTVEEFFMQKDFPKNYLLQVCYCDIKGSRMGAEISNLYELYYLGYRDKIRKLGKRFPAGLPKNLVDGNDIKKALSIKPGPKIAKMLQAVREEQLAGKIKTKKQALNFLK